MAEQDTDVECDCPLRGGSFQHGNLQTCLAESEDGLLCSKPKGHDGPHAACNQREHPIDVWGA